eukprot:957939-Prymnesium_polylepis.1
MRLGTGPSVGLHAPPLRLGMRACCLGALHSPAVRSAVHLGTGRWFHAREIGGRGSRDGCGRRGGRRRGAVEKVEGAVAHARRRCALHADEAGRMLRTRRNTSTKLNVRRWARLRPR